MLGDIYVNEELYGLGVAAHVRAQEQDRDGGAQRAIRAAKVLVGRSALPDARRLLEQVEALAGARLQDAERKEVLKLRARLIVAAAGGGDAEAEAVPLLEQIVALDPLDGEALILLGQHHARAGDAERAVFCYERAANLEPTEADAKLRHAQLLVGQGKYAEALPLLRRAQALKPRETLQSYLEQVERVAQAKK
jgi:cytochrome c-type biogenesis protein CcmH/NrfG